MANTKKIFKFFNYAYYVSQKKRLVDFRNEKQIGNFQILTEL